MPSMVLRVVRDGEPTDLKISPLAVIGWEKWSGRRLTDMSDGLGMSDLVVLAYEQARLQGLTDAGDFMEFASDLEDIEPPGPTEAGEPSGEEAFSDSTSNSPPP